MQKTIGIAFFFLLVVLSGCKKPEDWVGTYNGTAGNDINQVVITKVDKTTLKIELKALFYGNYVTYAVLYNAKLLTANKVTVNEDGALLLNPDTYHYTGSGTRSGKSLTLSGSATNKSNSSDIKYYSFSGSK